MTRLTTKQGFRVAYLAFLLASVHVCTAQQVTAPILDSEIVSLQRELSEQNVSRASATSRRRAYKGIVRSGDKLLDASPTAPNRFRVLSIILQSQRRLLALENSERNRVAFFETCSKLATAPDQYADLRLEADLLLSERELSLKNADIKERADALSKLIKRYRGTPGEARSLMIASQIAPRLEAFDLQKKIITTLIERFQGDHKMIEFRRKNIKESLLDVVFSGTYKRTDGSTLSFPIDRLGHTSLMYFWSKETPDIEQRLAEVKALQTRFSGGFEVFSFNLDELPDAGEETLRSLGLDWTALHLPGGRKNPAFQVYVKEDPGAVLVNAQGHALLATAIQLKGIIPLIPRLGSDGQPQDMAGSTAPKLEQCIDDARYLSQLQSLFIGDFLVVSPKLNHTADSVPEKTLHAIQACFTTAPMRYRLTQKQALANYQKAEKLCREAIIKYPKASDIWFVRNRRIIALLGMWNLATEPKHLEAAVQEAKTSLAMDLPPEANVVPRFCLAKDALRRDDATLESVPKAFIHDTGGVDASGTALAAAALLSLDANAREPFAIYRETLLDLHADAPALWPVTTFLRDRHHRYRMFRATHGRFGFVRAERHSVGRNVAALDEPADTTRVMQAEFDTLDGGKLKLPQDTIGKLTFVVFLELPADEESAKSQNTLVQQMTSIEDRDIAKGIKVIAAFLSDDTKRIAALVKENEWTCQVAIVPDGIKDPLVRRYGVLNADHMPNIFLLRGDGSISWSLSGITYPVQGSGMIGRIANALEPNISVCQMETATGALDKGEFQTAARLFSEALAPEKIKGDSWATFRFSGRARAHAGLKNWDAALVDIEVAIEAHNAFEYGRPHHCDLVSKLQLEKANILDQLGRTAEAKSERQNAAAPTHPHNPSPYGLYTEGLENFRLSPH